MDAKEILELIIYIAPGFIARRIYEDTHPGRKKSDFVETGSAVLTGAFITAIVKYADAHWLKHALNSDIKVAKAGADSDVHLPDLRFLAALVICGFIAGWLLVGYRALCEHWSQKHQWLRWLSPDTETVWAKINQRKGRMNSWVAVYVDGGHTYVGYIKRYTVYAERDYQEFFLAEARKVDENLNTDYEVSGEGVYLNTKNVKRIEFLTSDSQIQHSFADVNKKEEPAPPSPAVDDAELANDGNS